MDQNTHKWGNAPKDHFVPLAIRALQDSLWFMLIDNQVKI